VAVSTTGGDAWKPLDLPLPPDAANCFWAQVAFDGEGDLLVLYTPTGGPYNLPTGLWLQRFTADFTVDGGPVHVSGPLTFEPRLAVAGRAVLVAWVNAGGERANKLLGFGPPPNPIVVARSFDAGRTFGPPVTVSEPARLAVQPTLLAGPGGQVVVGAFDLGDDRTTYESLHNGQPGPPPTERWRVVVWSSSDGGATFGPATTVADGVVPSQRVLIDLAPAPAFALDPSHRRMYAAWESALDVVVARSDDGGRTFSEPVTVSEPSRLAVQPTLLAGSSGQIVVGAFDLGDDRTTYESAHNGQPGPPPTERWRIVMWASSDGGATFGPATTVADGVVPSQRVLIDLAPAPAFALDTIRGRIYAAWESALDVLVARSDDGGRTWSPPHRVGPPARGQFLPGIGVAPDGRVDVAFYDRSGDADDVLAEVAVASSWDGGRSFTTGRASDQRFDSYVGSFTGADVMLGSHMAVVSRATAATVIWADTARGNRVNNIVDLVSARVEIRRRGGLRGPLVMAGVFLAAVGAGLATARSWPYRGAGRGRRHEHHPGASPPPPRRG
jgi:hypothetical protein